ncbi:MAG: chemotaxis protein CheD [Myxococcota bacterium]
MEKQQILGVGDFAATNESGGSLKTFALGSCVAVILLDPKCKAVGMVHVALPRSDTNRARAREKPGYFADTGIDALVEEMARIGCDPKGRGMVVKLAGGARVLDMDATFDIGHKNALAVRKHLWSMGLGPVAEDLGGTRSRTVEIDVDTGCVTIFASSGERWGL